MATALSLSHSKQIKSSAGTKAELDPIGKAASDLTGEAPTSGNITCFSWKSMAVPRDAFETGFGGQALLVEFLTDCYALTRRCSFRRRTVEMFLGLCRLRPGRLRDGVAMLGWRVSV